MRKTYLGRLRLVALLEGISYLVLLGVGMPLKYVFGFPEMVRISGSLHGLLFVLLVLAIAHLVVATRWPLARAFAAFAYSLVPFGAFVFDRSLKREQEQLERGGDPLSSPGAEPSA